MKIVLLFLAGIVIFWTSAPVIAGSLDASLVGRYTRPGQPDEYVDLRADGTFTLLQGPKEGASGDCTAQGTKVTLLVPGNSVVLQISGGVFTGPDGQKWQKVPGSTPAPPPADLPNFIGKSADSTGTPIASSDRGTVVKCIINVKQLLVGCSLWAADHKGTFPNDLNELFTPKYLGAGKQDLLQVPMAQDEKTAGYLYYGKKQTDAMPGDKILILSKWKDAQGKHIIGRRDGSVVLAVPTKADYPAK